MKYFFREGDTVALCNDEHWGVFTVPSDWEVPTGTRCRDIELPDEAVQTGGPDEASNAFCVNSQKIKDPTPADIKRCEENHSETYDDGRGYSEDYWFFGKSLLGNKIPCTASYDRGAY